MNPETDHYADVVADLDGLEHVPDDALTHALAWEGTCLWLRATGTEPEWTHDDRTDRQITASICADCPVQRECLELEFRQSGSATQSVWGPLSAEDRREAFLVWADRRDGAGERR